MSRLKTLWLRGDWLGLEDRESWLWIHLEDGQLLAFRLRGVPPGEEDLLPELIRRFLRHPQADEVPLREDATAFPLDAVPAAVLPDLPWGDPRHEAARRFAEGLDQEILRLLARLDHRRHFDSVVNYNRLARRDPKTRLHRFQALDRFPALVAPLLLTPHPSWDFKGGRRHVSRREAPEVEEAIDRGRNLVGALARHYGISKSLVRAPLCRQMVPRTALPFRKLLELLDGIPAHRRPQDPDEIRAARPLLAFLAQLADERTD